MKKTIKCSKNFLSLGFLIPEIKLDWLPWKDSITSMLKRDKVAHTKGPAYAEKIDLPSHYIIHEDPTSREWTRHDCSRKNPISL